MNGVIQFIRSIYYSFLKHPLCTTSIVQQVNSNSKMNSNLKVKVNSNLKAKVNLNSKVNIKVKVKVSLNSRENWKVKPWNWNWPLNCLAYPTNRNSNSFLVSCSRKLVRASAISQSQASVNHYLVV